MADVEPDAPPDRVVHARAHAAIFVEHWGVPDRFALLAQTGVLDRLSA